MSTFELGPPKGAGRGSVSCAPSGQGPDREQNSEANKSTYLHPGQTYVTTGPARICTIVGSCVAVFLWDLRRNSGGVTHYLLPEHDGRSPVSSRYGNVALPGLLDKLLQLGCRKRDLLAKVYGGACLFEAFRPRAGEHLGTKNSVFALQWLEQQGITVVETLVGGTRGRKIEFSTDGTTSVREV